VAHEVSVIVGEGEECADYFIRNVPTAFVYVRREPAALILRRLCDFVADRPAPVPDGRVNADVRLPVVVRLVEGVPAFRSETRRLQVVDALVALHGGILTPRLLKVTRNHWTKQDKGQVFHVLSKISFFKHILSLDLMQIIEVFAFLTN